MDSTTSIQKPEDRPVICTICSDAGVGKTSLAATFPKPIFIRSEDGLQAIAREQRPDAFPVISKTDDLWDQLKYLIYQEHDYKTVVIDSVTTLERLFIQFVIDSDKNEPRSINQAMGGYGAGLSAVATLHHRVRKACGILNEKRGMHVVFIAHADLETIDLPDADPYSRYSLRLGKKSMAPYVDEADIVGFIKLQTFTTGEGERKKAISDGSRLLVTYATAASISKNRFGITNDLPFKLGENPLVEYIPTLRQEV